MLPPVPTCLLLLALLIHPPPSLAVQNDEHDFGTAKFTSEMLLQRYPQLMDIMRKTQSSTIDVPLIITEYPDLWESFKQDAQVWAWFQTNMPHYTIERPKVYDLGEAADPTGEILVFCDKLVMESLADPDVPPPYVDIYMKYQNLKWTSKNHARAKGMAQDTQQHEQRAWESHAIDWDYPVFFERYNVPKNARVLDIGTEMGLQVS